MKVKKITAAFAAALTIGTAGVVAFAANTDSVSPRYSDYVFSFSFHNGDTQYSLAVQKEDNEDYAMVHTQGGNLGSNMAVYFSVVDGNTVLSYEKYADENRYDYRLDYIRGETPAMNNDVKLQAKAASGPLNTLHTNGYWNP